jgi:hypothetical protein
MGVQCAATFATGQNVISPVPAPRESAPTEGEMKGQNRMWPLIRVAAASVPD